MKLIEVTNYVDGTMLVFEKLTPCVTPIRSKDNIIERCYNFIKRGDMNQFIDIAKMPGYEFRDGFKGINSVSSGKVYLHQYNVGLYPACSKHGAILCIAVREDGKIWRCREPGCDEGCFEKLTP